MVKFYDVEVRGNQLITLLPPAGGGGGARAQGGSIIMRTSGLKRTTQVVGAINNRIIDSLEKTAEEKAQALQDYLQAALLQEYAKTGTGRFARGIRVAVVRQSSDGRSSTSLQVKAITYRETKFLTNLGGTGYFKEFPVSPYRIYARGAGGILSQIGGYVRGEPIAVSELGNRGQARFLRSGNGISRLKVPRRGVFFTAARRPGRGGGESRIVQDILGEFLPDEKSAAFFYPLWVNHPGFKRDLLSELVVEQGGIYQHDVLNMATEELRRGMGITVPSGRIPLAQGSVQGSTQADVVVPVFVLRTR